MTTASYDDRTAAYRDRGRDLETRRSVSTARAPMGPGMIFLLVAWLAAAAFWAFSLQIDFGILSAVQHPTVGAQPTVMTGGLQVALMTVVGVVVLGLALAYGLARYVTRDRRNDPITEATTAALYDQAGDEPDGGTSRSPRADTPQARAINRGVQPPTD